MRDNVMDIIGMLNYIALHSGVLLPVHVIFALSLG